MRYFHFKVTSELFMALFFTSFTNPSLNLRGTDLRYSVYECRPKVPYNRGKWDYLTLLLFFLSNELSINLSFYSLMSTTLNIIRVNIIKQLVIF